MEIAGIVTDDSLNIIEEGPNIIVHVPKEKLEKMGEWCIEHHGDSGLTRKCLESTVLIKEAEDIFMKFVLNHFPVKGVALLAGNSVYMDRMFLRREMPNLDQHLHYRIMDVSTIKECIRRWSPRTAYQAPSKRMTHRALDDIKESIEEMRFYRNNIFQNKS